MADPEVLVGIRRNYLNVYWRGQSLFRARKGSSRPAVTTHAKFLLDPDLKVQAPLIDGLFQIDDVVAHGFMRKYEGPATLQRLKRAARLYVGVEKKGCHEIALRNASVIDVEIAFPGISTPAAGARRPSPRVDFAVVSADGSAARLVFWEAKDYVNGELRASKFAEVPVCRQVRKYREYLVEHRTLVEDSYRRVAANLVALHRLGLQRPLSPIIEEIGDGRRPLTLGSMPQVGLVIFGFDDAQKRDKRWQDHLKRIEAEVGKDLIKLAGDPKHIHF